MPRAASEQQGRTGSISQQLAELRQRIAEDGGSLDDDACFIDNGVSGASLERPALQRLRELAARGALDRLYVLAPDRLARSTTALAQLMREFTQAGVELIFVDSTTSQPTRACVG
jgi:site-specific DNA recombinase